ncbi:hypothetical protein ACJX0J_039797, partial [Zea mays]
MYYWKNVNRLKTASGFNYLVGFLLFLILQHDMNATNWSFSTLKHYIRAIYITYHAIELREIYIYSTIYSIIISNLNSNLFCVKRYKKEKKNYPARYIKSDNFYIYDGLNNKVYVYINFIANTLITS